MMWTKEEFEQLETLAKQKLEDTHKDFAVIISQYPYTTLASYFQLQKENRELKEQLNLQNDLS